MFVSLEKVIPILIAYKYFLLFPLTVIEGPIITIIAGFLASHGYFSVFIVYVIVVIGDLAGDFIYYLIGRYSRTKFIQRWGHYIGITPARVESLDSHFVKHAGKTLIAGKLSHGVGAMILVAAGAAKLPISKFLWFNFIATLPKSLVLLLIGFYFGKAYAEWNRYLGYTAIFMTLIAVLFVVIYFIMKKVSERYQ